MVVEGEKEVKRRTDSFRPIFGARQDLMSGHIIETSADWRF
jgi:hypothetical protein